MKTYKLVIPNEIFAHRYTITHLFQLPIIRDETDNIDISIKKEKEGYNYVSLKVKDIQYEEIFDGMSRIKRKTKIKKFRLHRLLALQFIQKTKDDIFYNRDQVSIIDGNKDNLSLNNLIWMNRYESIALSILKNKGIDSMINYCIDDKNNMDINNIIHVMFDTNLVKNRIFKKRYIRKLINNINND